MSAGLGDRIMLDVAEAFRVGWEYHRAGDVTRAEQLYLQVLDADPRHADAWHLLGAACLMQGRVAEAVGALQRALEINPDHGAAHDNLGIALARQGKLADAVASFRQAVRLKPEHAESHLNLGGALARLGRLEEAISCYQEAIRLQPDHAEAHYKLGKALAHRGRRAEAVASWQRATALNPRHAHAHAALGEALAALGRRTEATDSYRRALELSPDHFAVLMNLGCLVLEGQPEEALALFRRAVRVRPGAVLAHANVGFALIGLERFEEAEATFREALVLDPAAPEALSGLGIALARQDRHEEAAACQRRALELRPDYTEAHHNLGVSLLKLGKPEEAIAAHQEALRCRPDAAESHGSLAVAYLVLGRYPEGWPEYEWRWRCKMFADSVRSFTQPQWDGSALGGRTILIHAEQGFGDVLQFIRYAPLVKARGSTVLVECPAPLHPILARCRGIDRLLPQKAPLPPFDVHAPVMSLPGIFGTTVDTIPADCPYLAVPDELVERWRRELEPIEGFKVGICWRGNAKNPYDRYRSLRLEQLEPLARVPGVRLVSLQKGPGTTADLRQAGGRVPLLDLGPRLDREAGAFVETGAVMKSLDLVLSVDTAPGHLAGGLAVPFWVLLPFAPEWRWLLEREDSPWYPTGRLFRQRRPGDWDEVIARVAAALQERAMAGRTP
jgi:tetratricopeptide (TPR) repeat protein